MSYVLKNVSVNRSIICTLKDGSTLRLFPKGSVTLKDSQLTKHLEEVAGEGKLLTITAEVERKVTKKSTEKEVGEKEE